MVNFNNWKNNVAQVKANLIKTDSPLRIGILGAASINYTAIIDPCQTHPDAVIVAIAARSKQRAETQITKYAIPNCKAYGTYQELLDDTDIDAVYIPLPNGLHAEWAIAAMNAGKHALVEKPMASNASEVQQIKETSERTGKIALEAFHWRFHPLSIRVKEIIDSGKYGDLKSIDVKFLIPRGALAADDIRFKYELAGGSTMDLTYVLSACRFFTGDSGTTRIEQAVPRFAKDERIDEAMVCDFVIERDGKPVVQCHTRADAMLAPLFGFIPKIWDAQPVVVIELENAKVEYFSFAIATFGNGIVIHEKGQDGKVKKMVDGDLIAGHEQSYGDVHVKKWWTTYRFQLENFVGKIRANEVGNEWTGPWMSMEQSVAHAECIDAVYKKADMPLRGVQ